jgi:hypothetical protein
MKWNVMTGDSEGTDDGDADHQNELGITLKENELKAIPDNFIPLISMQ